mgnify:CR=1 FL=1
MIDLKKVDQASKMAARWLVKSSQIMDRDDPSLGAFRTEYDPADRKLRLSQEVWQTSEAIRALLKIHARTGNPAWKDSALLAGRYLESTQCTPKDGMEAGSLWKPWLQGKDPLSVSMNYRSIVGFLELYSATGASHYLNSSRAIVDWFMKRVYRGGGTHLDRFFPDKKAFGWPRSHILEEGSFVTLHDLTREDRYAAIFREQVDGLISSLEPEGTFSCMHTARMETEAEAGPNEISSRGMYWHLIPMLMVQLKRSSARTMDALNSGAALMKDLQDPEGFLSRTYPLERAGEARSEPDGAATAMFAFIWMKMHEVSGEEGYGQSAEKALSWMLKSQFVVHREVDAFGAFFQERKLHEGRAAHYLGGLASIYGILACEEYLRVHGRR